MDFRVSIRRREMDSNSLKKTQLERERQKERYQMLHAGSHPEAQPNQTFLKVAPNLFTTDKLHMFDSLDLYTSLIKCSKFMEQGERLHNLSWRIINKSLLTEHDINKSKRKDGVRNLYNVINPIKQTHFITHIQHQQQLPPSTGANSPNRNIAPLSPQFTISKKLMSANVIGSETILTRIETPTRSQNVSPDLRKSIVRKRMSLSPEATHIDGMQSSMVVSVPSQVLPDDDSNSKQNNSSLFSRNSSAKSLFVKNGSGTASKDSTASNSLEKSTQTNNQYVNKLRNSSSIFQNGNNHVAADGLDGSHNHHEHRNMFFSSEDEESDWDSISDDSDFYDDDVEDIDQYYEEQWDNMMFSKTNASPAGQPAAKDTGEKKSLLSGLFMQEKQEKSQEKLSTDDAHTILSSTPARPVVIPSKSQSQPVAPETTEIVAVGSVTPSSSWKNKNMIEQQVNESSIQKSDRRGSFSSIVSDTTGRRYYHESNAPPAAQTILPTALSTHMFLPNNVHQQRMAMRGENYSRIKPEHSTTALRRESMDIPSKNRNNSFLKTRMEISEEESFVRAFSRFKKQDQQNF